MEHTSATFTHAHAHTQHSTRTKARTHTQICNIYCFSTATMIRERASVLRFTYIVCLVITTTDCVYYAVVQTESKVTTGVLMIN